MSIEPGTTAPKKRWYSRFERVTSGRDFVPWIDGLRCVAILAVVLYHLNGYVVAKAPGIVESQVRSSEIFKLLNGANCGVQIFFAISGFVLALPFARLSRPSEIPYSRYYLRRLTRLEPPFLINILIATALIVIVKGEAFASLWRHLLATVTYSHNWVYGEHSLINGVTWSLEFEVQFYLVAPLLFGWYFSIPAGIRRTLSICLLMCFCVFKVLYPINGSLELKFGALLAFDQFWAGVLVADWYSTRPDCQDRHSVSWDLASVLTLCTIFWIQRFDFGRSLLSILSAILIFTVANASRIRNLLSNRAIVIIGGMCYTIYLYHFYVISLAGRLVMPKLQGLDFRLTFLLSACLCLPLILFVCGILFIAFERPFMVWRPFSKNSASKNR